jgi:hypothetical protein
MEHRDKFELPGLQFGGWVWSGDGKDAAPVPGAVVTMVERGVSTTTDSKGRYRFDYVPYGTYTLRATADGAHAERRLELPGEDYDLTLGESGGKDDQGANEGSKASETRDGGKGRRR